METGYPDMSAQPVLGRRNALQAAIVLLVPLPAIAFTSALFGFFPQGGIPNDPGWAGLWAGDTATRAAFLLHHPVATVNAIFFVNVCVGFWIIALVQRSAWLIDPYWTLIPPLIVAFYASHPLAEPVSARALLGFALMGVWSVRLTHSYLRREQWRLGFREDWRFAERRRRSRHFWWFQFFYVFVAQQFMLVGLTLPYYAIHFRAAPFGVLDALLGALALAGIAIAHRADTTLDAFMRANEARIARGEPKQQILEDGIWGWSRHPNYFGEQLFWWAVAGMGIALGVPWVVLGTALNSGVLAMVTYWTEQRMLADAARTDAFRDYRSRVPVWLPRPPAREQHRTV